MAIFRRWRAGNKETVHEAFERGEASFADEESDKIVPTLIGETSMSMDDADAIEADEKEVERLAPGTPLATEANELEKKALADVESAKAALADAQAASDSANDAYAKLNKQYRRDEVHGVVLGTPRFGEPGGPAQAEDADVMSDRQRVEADLAAASLALADADAAKVQADEDLRRARAGESATGNSSPG